MYFLPLQRSCLRAFIVDEKTGNITLVQGDSGTLIVQGLPSDKNYTVYFAIYNENRKIIGEEMKVQSNGSDVVTLKILSSLTDLLKVDLDETTAEYYYGLKLCNEDTDYEDTLCVGNNDIDGINTITVYPKKVEGVVT